MPKPKVTIAIPSYNQESLINDAIVSATAQLSCLPATEIIVIDDCSTDKTYYKISRMVSLHIMKNSRNIGFAKNCQKLVDYASGEYIVFLCGDDMFSTPEVVSDIVEILDANPDVGIVGRSYYQYMDGKSGAVVSVDEKDIRISTVNPSGMGFRKEAIGRFNSKIYLEFAEMVDTMLKDGWKYKTLDYDTIAVRIHKHNQAISKAYYHGSLIQNWYNLIGDSKVVWDFKSNYVCLKNRVGLMYLLSEIRKNIKVQPLILLSPLFWFFAIFTIVTPSPILICMSDFYRDKISRRWTKIKHREYGPLRLNLGCGRNQRTDAINIDTTAYEGVDDVVDLSEYPWKWKDESIDGIYASHVIEHLPNQVQFISECLRILKPGGFLRLNLPHSSSVTSIGCFGHYRTFSWNTMHQYLGSDYYMFGKSKFKTVEQRLNWWYEVMDTQVEVPKWMFVVIVPVNKILTFLANLSPRVCENLWCYWCGGFREVIWKGEKI